METVNAELRLVSLETLALRLDARFPARSENPASDKAIRSFCETFVGFYRRESLTMTGLFVAFERHLQRGGHAFPLYVTGCRDLVLRLIVETGLEEALAEDGRLKALLL